MYTQVYTQVYMSICATHRYTGLGKLHHEHAVTIRGVARPYLMVGHTNLLTYCQIPSYIPKW